MLNPLSTVRLNKLTAFVIGTVAIQSYFLLSAFYLHSYSLSFASASESSRTASAIERSIEGSQEAGGAHHHRDRAEHQGPKQVTYRIENGDTLTKIWTKNGGSYAGAMSAADALKKAGVALNELKLGEELELTLSADGDIVQMKKRLKEGRTVTLKGDSQAGYEASLTQSKVVTQQRTVTSTIYTSFAASAREADVPREVVDDLVDLFSGRIEFKRHLQPGDTFAVIYDERVNAQGDLVSVGAIQAASIENGGKLYVAIRDQNSTGNGRYYDETGNLMGNYFLRYPVNFTRISSVFSTARFHPILNITRPHNGVDFAAPTGTPVRSIADGVVESAGWNNECGNGIRIKHDDHYTTQYLHLSKIAAGMKPGMRVTRGQVIGNVGMTGLATAPHLHFGMFVDGKYVDPLRAKLPTIQNATNGIAHAYFVSMMETLKQKHQTIRMAALSLKSAKA